jgi:plasmid maintenance system antidote protein VapI
MRTKRFGDQLRDAVDASGMSRYAICKAIDLPESSMSRFMTGKGGVSMDTLDKLAELLGLSVASRSRRRKGGG